MIDLLSVIIRVFRAEISIKLNRLFREKEKYCKIGTNSDVFEKMIVFNNIPKARANRIARECHGDHQSETKSRLGGEEWLW